jgi:ribosomal protein L11 methyltransferase
MPWVSVAIDVGADKADALADALLEHGACSVDVSDAHAGGAQESALFDEPDVPRQSGWALSRISALFETQVDYEDAVRIACLESGLEPTPPIHSRVVPEQDWVRATQQQFQPIQISERLWIVPTWCEPPVPQAINLRLDPGLAFGTGTHPTTWQCLRWLDQNLRVGQSVLDYGCGSGILAIAAKRLGAQAVVGVDLDPNALRASAENARMNCAEAQFIAPDSVPRTSFDVVIANILANPLRMLAPVLAAHTAIGGHLVLAGILQTQSEALRLAYLPWFDLKASEPNDGWTCMWASRRD